MSCTDAFGVDVANTSGCSSIWLNEATIGILDKFIKKETKCYEPLEKTIGKKLIELCQHYKNL